MTQPVSFIDTSNALGDFLGGIPNAVETGPICSLDTEADSLHSYREKLCLMQFGCDGHYAIVDPLAIDDLSVLVTFLDRSQVVWMHGADYDMTLMKRTFDTIPPVVFDTQVAARLTGHRKFGLADLLGQYFGLEISKKSQRANWAKRPLTEKLLDYARTDVEYLLPLAEILTKKLHELGRFDWFQQSCEAARETVLTREPKTDSENWRISGWGALSRRGMAYLRELWRWRDFEANRRDRPPFKIIGNEAILEYARNLENDQSVKLPPRFKPNQVERFEKAIEEARAIPDEELPSRKRGKRLPRKKDSEDRFDALRHQRNVAAADLDIDPTLIASRAVLERIAAGEEFADQLQPWQRQLLEPALAGTNVQIPESNWENGNGGTKNQEQ